MDSTRDIFVEMFSKMLNTRANKLCVSVDEYVDLYSDIEMQSMIDQRKIRQERANNKRSIFMLDAHKSDERKKKASLAGKEGVKSLILWKQKNKKRAREISVANAKHAANVSKERKIGIFGLTKDERLNSCSLGGSANTESQKKARKKQLKEHFAPAGTKAAAERKMARWAQYEVTFFTLLPDGWFTVKDAQSIADEKLIILSPYLKNRVKFAARNHLNKYINNWYECKKSGKTLFYKKIETNTDKLV
jgi:hypothetical protein